MSLMVSTSVCILTSDFKAYTSLRTPLTAQTSKFGFSVCRTACLSKSVSEWAAVKVTQRFRHVKSRGRIRKMFTQAGMERGLTLWSETDKMDKPQGGTQTTSKIFFNSPVRGCVEAAGECVVCESPDGSPAAEASAPPAFQHNAQQHHGKVLSF